MSKKKLEVALIGAGRMAQVVGHLLLGAGHHVRLWTRSPASHPKLAEMLPGLEFAPDLETAITPADVLFLAIPTDALIEVCTAAGAYTRGYQVVLHASRGIADGFLLPHQAIRSVTGLRKIGALGGPLHSRDLGSGRAVATALASRFAEVFETTHELVRGSPVTLHTSFDITGVEVAGAISNVSAIATGMAEALELGDTARGLLLVHGLSEAEHLGLRLGAEAETFAGLAGVGDLIPRSVSSTDRHRVLGSQLARGVSFEEAQKEVGARLEGPVTASEVHRWATTHDLSLPLVSAVHSIILGERPAREGLEAVLKRDLRDLAASKRGREARR